MNTISPYNAIDSLYRALVPGRDMIDGRTESDRLWFMAEFASLINFYNNSNNIQGNWKPFLLKDPVILLAYISKTPYAHFYSRYIDTCLAIEAVTNGKFIQAKDILAAYKLLNQLFGRFKDVYEQIGCWAYYMQLSAEDYELNAYITGLIKSTFSPYYWALRAMHTDLFSSLNEIIKTELRVLAEPEYFNNDLWLNNKCNGPWWEMFGLKEKPCFFEPASDQAIDASNYKFCFTTLKKAGDNLFRFFKNAITYSYNDFEKLAGKRSKYPDTTLLRAFVRLLKIHQEQLNGITQKHLDFYYRDILKQSELTGESNSIYIAVAPKAKGSVIKLPAGTAFHVAANNNTKQVFCTMNEEVLHPVTIAGATTLSFISSGGTTGLFQHEIDKVSTTQFTEDGQVKSWRTFGGKYSGTHQSVAMGVAFASPMLFLIDGTRTITLIFTFSSPQGFAVFSNAAFYLSTQKKWLEVPAGNAIQINYLDADNKVITAPPYAGAQVVITLDPAQPSIENFTVNPDGVKSQWPMLKILFSNLVAGTAQAFIQTLAVSVSVGELKSFQLFNDSGAISLKTPYTPFGTTPALNSNFIIGSDEIFSKPISQLSIAIEWSNLPKLPAKSCVPLDDFETYYNSYNQYCTPASTAINAKTTVPPSSIAPVAVKTGIVQTLKNIFKWSKNKFSQILALISKEITVFFSVKSAQPDDVFNNGSFTVGFQLLQDASWNMFSMIPSVGKKMKIFLPYDIANSLFRVDENQLLVDTSAFESVQPPEPVVIIQGDPAIQNAGLTFTDKSASGFMKMTLTGPAQGFGGSLYSKVIAYISTQNAMNITSWSTWFTLCKPTILPPANLPFVPRVSSLTGSYTASVTYDLTSQEGSYPLQCFSYSPFAVYEIYNNTAGSAVKTDQVITAIAGPASRNANGITFFPAFNYNGALLLEFSRLLPGNTINFYFELVRKNTIRNTDSKVDYSYLSESGWQPLEILFDGTNNFACSGIIKLNIPAGITNTCAAMAGSSYWIALSAQGKLQAFPQTVCLSVNGIEIQNADVSFLKDMNELQAKNTSIAAKPVTPVTPIAAVVKPLSSPKEITSENTVMMNRRISARIKTKDRIVTRADFYILINNQFNYIFYSKITDLCNFELIDRPCQTALRIYLVKKAGGYAAPNAFLPFITQADEDQVRVFLNEKVSPLINLQVSNFEPQYVKVCIWVTLKGGFENEEGTIKLLIRKALNIYLSPWISSDQKQVTIETPLTDSGVADCVLDIEGVNAVSKVNFTTWVLEEDNSTKIYVDNDVNVVKPISPAYLFVSALNHCIKFKKAA
ncbi:MAG: hypothetical protein IPP72_16885 [Chitinophagaceae bacterium]|nr:hypothetical protein [Chitinophagaceae bacterium]